MTHQQIHKLFMKKMAQQSPPKMHIAGRTQIYLPKKTPEHYEN